VTGDLRITGGNDATGHGCEVLIVGGIVTEPGRFEGDSGGDPGESVPAYDASGLTVLPGLLDLQVNGAVGIDITDEPERLWDVAAALPAYGVTAFVPTVITSGAAVRDRAVKTFDAGPPDGWAGAEPLGLHFEGPMIALGRKGAHPPQWLVPPSLELVEGWSREAGVLMVTIAPELPGALEVMAELADRGVLVSVGHTEATAEETRAAVDAGARMLTHLGNAMSPLSARAPGPIGTALGGDTLVAGVIADGYHLDPLTLNTAWRALGPERFLAVTDTTMALGMPDGPGRLGDQDVLVGEGTVRLEDGTLAGSAASLPQCLRVLRDATGGDLGDVVATCTSTAAALVGDPARGHLRPGARGDVTLVDADLRLVATVVGGRVVHDTRGHGAA